VITPAIPADEAIDPTPTLAMPRCDSRPPAQAKIPKPANGNAGTNQSHERNNGISLLTFTSYFSVYFSDLSSSES
jgi:hypothetical protein